MCLPLLWSLLLLLFLFGLFGGMQRVVFQLLMAKVIPVTLRSRLQAWRNMAGGLIAAGLSYAAGRYLIENDAFGNGYSTTFLVAFALTSLGLTALRFMMLEPILPTLPPHSRVRDRLRDVPRLINSDRDYRNFLIAQALAMASRIGAPFYILHAGATMELSGATLGLLTLAFLGADTVSNLIWGYVGDRWGFKTPFAIALVLWIVSTLLLVFSNNMFVFMLAFGGLGAASSAYMLSSQTMVLEFGLRDAVAMRIAISSTVEGAIAALGPLLGGILAAAIGYIPVFSISVVIECVALVVLLVSVREPRWRDRPMPADGVLATAAAGAERFSFAAFGDTPYFAFEEPAVVRLIDSLADARVAFLVHIGDFKAAAVPCSDELIAERRRMFDASPVPFVFVPGDNEWTDCHRALAGSQDPLERLAKLRELFYPEDQSLGRQKIRLARQSDTARFSVYRENARWLMGGVVFVTLKRAG